MRYVINILFLLLSVSSFAQTNPLSRALKLYQGANLGEAKTVIDSVLMQEPYQEKVVAYYLKGFIYKDLYKSSEGQDEVLRSESIAAFVRVTELDSAGKYTQETQQNLKYLATTYYNDAMRKIRLKSFSDAESDFSEFARLVEQLKDPAFTLSPSSDQFYLALGLGYADDEVLQSDTSSFRKAEAAFKKVLSRDSLNMLANYSLGVLYYNEAVNRIDGLSFDEELTSFDQFEDRTIALFKDALPYMQTAYNLNPKDVNVVEGLAGIYNSLRDFDRYDRYIAELRELEKEE